MRVPLLFLLLLALTACGGPQEEARDDATEGALSPAQQADLIERLSGYAHRFGCVDDALRWAPTLCLAPPVPIRMSEAPEGKAHGRKLYWLFARDRDAYVSIADRQDQPVGQLIVKEAWVPAPGLAAADAPGPYGRDGRRVHNLKRSVEQDGKTWHADRLHALFVMWKRDPDTLGTDRGWTYATLSADGRTVTASGRLANCMACHADATHDRLFGLP